MIVGVAAVAVGGSADSLRALAPGSTVDIHCKGRAHMTEETGQVIMPTVSWMALNEHKGNKDTDKIAPTLDRVKMNGGKYWVAPALNQKSRLWYDHVREAKMVRRHFPHSAVRNDPILASGRAEKLSCQEQRGRFSSQF